MSRKNQNDSIKVHDRAGRRQFMRAGAAFVISAGAVSSVALAADCDQNAEQKTRCTDQDSGENGDPTGCGRCGRLVPTALPRDTTGTKKKLPKVARVVA